MPEDITKYVEVFGGGASLLFGREKQKSVEEIYNDFNSDLFNMMQCAKEFPMEFMDELKFLPLNSREEFLVLRNFIAQKMPSNYDSEINLAKKYLTPPEFEEIKQLYETRAKNFNIKRASTFFKVIKYSYGSGTKSFSCQPQNILNCLSAINECSKRLINVIIENKDFEPLVIHYDSEGTFFYCDPPYFGTEACYEVGFAKENHIRLRNILINIKGRVMISYNDHKIIREIYKDFYITETERLNNLAQRSSPGAMFKELIITNFDPEKQKRISNKQISLFDLG